jgi:5-methylcytosine-specific restriction endonuclease McrA
MINNDINLKSKSVLILNRNWIAINTTTVKHSLSLLYNNNAKSLLIDNDTMNLLNWEEWYNLDVCNDEFFINSVRKKVKIPKVIVLNFSDKIPKQSIKFTQNNIWERDNFTCQYTGKKLNKKSGNIDHVLPKARGGKTSWENCVLSHKDINSKKANKTPDEIGLRLLKKPKEPNVMPVSFYIKNIFNINEWDFFLSKKNNVIYG